MTLVRQNSNNFLDGFLRSWDASSILHATNQSVETSRPAPGLGAQPPPSLEGVPLRVREIAMLRGLGYSFREIGKQLSVSPQAVSLMLSRHLRSFQSLGEAMELGNLSARAVNVLGRHGINNRAKARQRGVLELLQNERNCGRKTLEEISRWIGTEHGESLADDRRDIVLKA